MLVYALYKLELGSEYGQMDMVGLFTTREKAEAEMQKRFAELQKNEDEKVYINEDGSYVSTEWYGETEIFDIIKWEVK